jgi:hypothetical protein
MVYVVGTASRGMIQVGILDSGRLIEVFKKY